MSADLPEPVTVRPSFWRLCLLNLLSLVPLFVGFAAIGMPLRTLMSEPVAAIGVLLTSAFWVFGASAFTRHMLIVTFTSEGLMAASVLSWEEIGSVRAMLPQMIYVAAPRGTTFMAVFLPGPWLVADRAQLREAIRALAPPGHPIRRRLLGERQ